MKPLRISGLRATTVAVPLAAPLRHAAGAHWGRFVRTIVEVETDQGITGLGEMGGGGESAEAGGHARGASAGASGFDQRVPEPEPRSFSPLGWQRAHAS